MFYGAHNLFYWAGRAVSRPRAGSHLPSLSLVPVISAGAEKAMGHQSEPTSASCVTFQRCLLFPPRSWRHLASGWSTEAVTQAGPPRN